jgi:hypothetical protein
MENYLFFLCVFAGIASVGIIFGGIGIFITAMCIYFMDFSHIKTSISRAAFGINEAGTALTARLLTNVPIRHDVYIINDADISSEGGVKNCNSKCRNRNDERNGGVTE